MQSLILGLGAYLVIERLATVGAMFAASILLGRALQPVEQIVGSWRNLVCARVRLSARRDAAGGQSRSAIRRWCCRGRTGALSVEGCHLRAVRAAPKPILRGVIVQHRARRGARRHRPVGRRQIHAGAPDRRRARADRPARCGSTAPTSSTWPQEIARPASRLSAAGYRAVCRHGRRQYQPLPATARTTRSSRRRRWPACTR